MKFMFDCESGIVKREEVARVIKVVMKGDDESLQMQIALVFTITPLDQ